MNYAPELLMALMATAQNITLIAACAWTTVKLYRMSGSWHCLWALSMLLLMVSWHFVQD